MSFIDEYYVAVNNDIMFNGYRVMFSEINVDGLWRGVCRGVELCRFTIN